MPDKPAPDLSESKKQRAVRVFVSSTFRDMHAERDELVKFIFPELRRRCRERYVEFVEVDLRWGITEEESKRGQVLPICLEEIKRCKPYFIGLLGERYGLPIILRKGKQTIGRRMNYRGCSGRQKPATVSVPAC